jgi:hypothetical protein
MSLSLTDTPAANKPQTAHRAQLADREHTNKISPLIVSDLDQRTKETLMKPKSKDTAWPPAGVRDLKSESVANRITCDFRPFVKLSLLCPRS